MNCPAFITKDLAGKVAIGLVLACTALPMALAEVVLYGGLGGHGVSSGPQASTNDGSLVIVSQTDGSTSVVGHPAGVARISGLAFGLDGVLFGATQVGGGFPPPPGPTSPSDLIRIDPDTGALLSSVPIMAGGVGISIADLTVHPTTGLLYGMRGQNDQLGGEGNLYIINTTTGAATLVGNTGAFFGSIAFAPDGTLYMSSASLPPVEGQGPALPFLLTLDSSSAAILSRVATPDFYHSLAVRPTDGVIFGGTADRQQVFTVNPATGGATFLGLTGLNFVGDLAFRTTTTPAGVDLHQHGFTGAWYEPATSGQGLVIEIFPNLAGPGNGIVAASWFTYDHSVTGGPERQRWYTLSGSVAAGAASASLVIYQNVGGNFNAPPITTAQQVGTATLRVTACDQVTLDYAFSDGTARIGSIPLTRLARNVTCASAGVPSVNADFAFSGNWYDPATSGQGFTIEINPMSAAAFLAWYTYAPSGAAAGAAGQRWYTMQSTYATGARTLPMTIYETTGGLFDSTTTPPPTTVAVGAATLAFVSCTVATLAYNFTGGSSSGATGTIALSRVGLVPPGCTM